MVAKSPGSTAPDGSKYVILIAETGTKQAGSQSKDGAKYVTFTNGNGTVYP